MEDFILIIDTTSVEQLASALKIRREPPKLKITLPMSRNRLAILYGILSKIEPFELFIEVSSKSNEEIDFSLLKFFSGASKVSLTFGTFMTGYRYDQGVPLDCFYLFNRLEVLGIKWPAKGKIFFNEIRPITSVKTLVIEEISTGYNYLDQFPNLETLCLYRAKYMTLTAVKKHGHLRVIKFGGSKLDSLHEIENCPLLEELTLGEMRPELKEFSSISKARNLKYLNILRVHGLRVIPTLSDIPLQKIVLNELRNLEDITSLLSAPLREISLMNCPKVSFDQICVLSGISTLKSVTLNRLRPNQQKQIGDAFKKVKVITI
jgi:hypothetical protein